MSTLLVEDGGSIATLTSTNLSTHVQALMVARDITPLALATGSLGGRLILHVSELHQIVSLSLCVVLEIIIVHRL